MKKIFYSILFIVFLIPAPLTFGDPTTFDVIGTPDIPIITGKSSNKPADIGIASFEYVLAGDITDASVFGEWGSTNINKLSQVDLYLDDILLIDFGAYYSGLSKSDKKKFNIALKRGKRVPFDIDIPYADWEALEDGLASLHLVGKPKFFSSLILDEITLRIVDPVPGPPPDPPPPNDPPPLGDPPPNVFDDPSPLGGPPPSAVPEPATMLLLGSGIIGLAGYGRRKFFKK